MDHEVCARSGTPILPSPKTELAQRGMTRLRSSAAVTRTYVLIMRHNLLRFSVVSLVGIVRSHAGGAQTPQDSVACHALLATPVRDSMDVTVTLTVRAFDTSVVLTPRYRTDIATGVRQFLRLPVPLPLTVYTILNEAYGDTGTVVPTMYGAYSARVARDGRLSRLSVVGGARASSFDTAVLAALQALSESSLAPALPATVHGDAVELRLSVATTDSTEQPAGKQLRRPSSDPLFRMKVPVLGRGKIVAPAPGNVAPRYPSRARALNVEGKVVLQFVVSANGRGEANSIQITETTAREFAEEVLLAFPAFAFRPLEVRGCKLPSVVAMPFEFQLRR